jgi:hypothetical protein
LLGAVADHLLHRPSRPVAVLPHGYEGWPTTQRPRSPQGGLRWATEPMQTGGAT